MANAKEIVSGVGARYAVVIPLDADGLPSVNVKQAAPQQGTLIEGIKTLARADGQVQRINHYGDDYVFAQDTLAPTEAGSITVTAAKTNLALDAMMESNKVVSAGTGKYRAGNTDKRGSEPQLGMMAYRQALDTTKGSPTLGKLRQWNIAIYGSVRFSPVSQPYEQAATDKTYNGTPTPTTTTLWGEQFEESSWGNSTGEYLDGVENYQPRLNWWRGDGTLTAFELSHPPVSADELTVWIAGTLTTPSSVNISAANPAFTLSAPVADDAKMIALIKTTAPGNS